MDDKQRIESLRKVILEKKDSSFLERLELLKTIDKKESLENFILTCLFFLEHSEFYYESASSLLLRKIYNEKIFLTDKQPEALLTYGRDFLKIIADKAIYPYSRTSNTFRRLISSIIYGGDDVADIIALTPKDTLIALNVDLLKKYLESENVSIGDALIMCYNCVYEIDEDDHKITIAEEATSLLKSYLLDHFESYLRIFIRPYYISASNDFPGIELHVPEPFYQQIFGSHDNFLQDLQNYDGQTNSNKIISADILKFMELYQKNNFNPIGIPHEFNANLHKNVRLLKG